MLRLRLDRLAVSCVSCSPVFAGTLRDSLARHARNPSIPCLTEPRSAPSFRHACDAAPSPARRGRETQNIAVRNAASFTASSSDIGRSATPSVERTTCGSANGECDGNECTSIGTALRPALLFVATFTATFAFRHAPAAATSAFAALHIGLRMPLDRPESSSSAGSPAARSSPAHRAAPSSISVASQRATSFWCLVCTVTSAICRYLSVDRITCTLPELPTIFSIRASPASACSLQLFCDGCLSAGVLHVHPLTSSLRSNEIFADD